MHPFAQIALIAAITLLMPATAEANVPIGAAFFLSIPLIAGVQSQGAVLLMVILIEWLAIHKMLQLSFLRSLYLSFLANLVSTILGILIVSAFSAGMLILLLIPCAGALAHFLAHFSHGVPSLEKVAKHKLLTCMLFLGMFVVAVFLGALLLPLTSSFYHGRMPAPNTGTVVAAFAVILVFGFVITVVTEGYVLQRGISDDAIPDRSAIAKTVFIMNLLSYAAIGIASGFSLSNILNL